MSLSKLPLEAPVTLNPKVGGQAGRSWTLTNGWLLPGGGGGGGRY